MRSIFESKIKKRLLKKKKGTRVVSGRGGYVEEGRVLRLATRPVATDCFSTKMFEEDDITAVAFEKQTVLLHDGMVLYR